MSGIVPLLHRSVHQDLYAWALAQAYLGDWRVYDPSYALSQDPDIYAKVERDAIIAQAIRQRQHAVAGKRWTVESASDDPRDKRLAQVVEQLLKKVKRFNPARFQLSKAFLLGSTFAAIEGRFRKVKLPGDTAERSWWVCEGLKDVDRRRFMRWSTRDQDTQEVHVRWKMWSLATRQFEELTHPEWYVKHIYDDREASLGHGVGLIEPLYWYFMAKGIALREGLAGLERWAQGWVIAKVSPEREASVDRTNDDVVERWIDRLQKHRSRHVFVHSTDEEIEVKDAPMGAAGMVTEYLNYLDSAVTRLLTGSLLPSGGGGQAGSYARADVESDVSVMVTQYDQELLDETMSDQLIGFLCDINRPVLAEIGLDGATLPHLRSVRAKFEDPEANARVIQAALQVNVPLVAAEVYEKLGMTKPTDEDELIEPVQNPMPGQVTQSLQGSAHHPFALAGAENALSPEIPGPDDGLSETDDGPVYAYLGNWDESKHPRDENGRFKSNAHASRAFEKTLLGLERMRKDMKQRLTWVDSSAAAKYRRGIREIERLLETYRPSEKRGWPELVRFVNDAETALSFWPRGLMPVLEDAWTALSDDIGPAMLEKSYKWLSKQIGEAVRTWQGYTSEGATPLNAFLWGKKFPKNDNFRAPEDEEDHGYIDSRSDPDWIDENTSEGQMARHVANMDRLIEKAPKFKEPVTVYRGVHGTKERTTDLLRTFKRSKGKTVALPGFQSTSVKLSSALAFLRYGEGPKLMLKIETDHGLAGFKDEYEFILGRDWRYKVGEIESKGDNFLVNLKVTSRAKAPIRNGYGGRVVKPAPRQAKWPRYASRIGIKHK